MQWSFALALRRGSQDTPAAAVDAVEPKLDAVPFMDAYAAHLVQTIRKATGREYVRG